MRTLRSRWIAQAVLLLAPATASQAETRLTWSCAAADGGAGRQVELIYFGPDVVPCKAYDRRSSSQAVLIADYQVSAGECERRVRDLVGALRGRGFDCPDPAGASLASLGAPRRGAPGAAPPALAADNSFFAILSRHPSADAAQAAVAKLRAADPPVKALILAPRGGSGTWLVALAAYTDAETAAKAVQFARASGLAPDAYFWSVPGAQAPGD